ncbi:MAG: hypothetical protein QT08_C0018G0015 [archaeon GW2011_AR17]|nr:MAG: hypothetical protein QT08_C0018G0015 [archaeon GW2011_AR17]MBS3154446.1 chorismate mutase [Candidatus Woesearchaeota archaeon]HIH15692.1 chorismate mutase [Nanoarchaeota archaeon]HIH59347.1 chorismate mutase [Nanoarchaeota archaeon]HII13575.1 chorismate mutase [Nanoarchaeota archaeon]
MELEKLRKELAKVDSKIVYLLEQRKNTVLKIGKIKELKGIHMVQKEREQKTLQRLVKQTNVDPKIVKKIYFILFSYSHKLQKKKRYY